MMSEEEKIELSPEDGKTESPEEVRNETQKVNSELSIVNEESKISKSEITTSEIKEMEVHHHPHVEKKNFKEYFLEFIMIFLAVTMGFVAENIREDITNHSKGKEFMKSMLEDLKTDTANINSFYSKADSSIDKIDSLMHLMKRPDRDKYGQTTYYLARVITTGIGRFVLADRTYEEMKSSGSLNLVNNSALSDSISKYYASQTDFKEQAQLQIQKMSEYTNSAAKIFDGAVFQQMLQRFPYKVIPPDSNPPLLTNNVETINEFIGLLHYYSAAIIINSSRAKQKLESTTRLIEAIQKEYNLKDE